MFIIGVQLNPMPFTAMLTNRCAFSSLSFWLRFLLTFCSLFLTFLSVVWGLYGFGKRDITMLTPQVRLFSLPPVFVRELFVSVL